MVTGWKDASETCKMKFLDDGRCLEVTDTTIGQIIKIVYPTIVPRISPETEVDTEIILSELGATSQQWLKI